MSSTTNLKTILAKQKEILSEMEQECTLIDNTNLEKENLILKSRLNQLELDHEKNIQKLLEFKDENTLLKTALYEQIYNEKLKIINFSEKKLELYFTSNIKDEVNKLSRLENSFKARIKTITNDLKKHKIDTKDEIYNHLDELNILLNEKTTKVRKELTRATDAFSDSEKEEFEKLKNEQITEEQVNAVVNKNSFERFIGLNILNILGIVLILIGVLTAVRYTYLQLPNEIKAVMIFLLGTLTLVFGEILNKKKPNIFSLGITSLGISVIYIALVTSYFNFKIITMYPALALCVLITIVAFLLSNRYNSQTILVFALVGGYLPMFSLNPSEIFIYGAMIYFVVLNLLALSISFYKKWTVASFIGLFFNTIATTTICSYYNSNVDITNSVIVILYVTFAFLNYTLIPIISNYKNNMNFKNSDILMIGINTVVSSIIMYSVFYMFGLSDFYGLLAIIFASIYLFLGKFVVRQNIAQVIFYLTGLAFTILIIPLQFGRVWLSLGWLAEGVTLSIYGILTDNRVFKRVGYFISSLCLVAFLYFDCLSQVNYLFSYKYFAITFCSLLILISLIYKDTLNINVYKNIVLLNIYIYMLYLVNMLNDKLYKIYGYDTLFNINYITTIVSITLTFLMAYFICRIKYISDNQTKFISSSLYVIGCVTLFITNDRSMLVNDFLNAPINIIFLASFILIAVVLLSIVAIRDLTMILITNRKISIEWYPIVISVYLVVTITNILIMQYNLSFSSVILSILYVLTALAWIVFGFIKRFSFIRRFGLALAVSSVIKLFLVDLVEQTEGYRTISYLVLGAILVAISFVYQYFSKRLESKIVGGTHEENN